MKVGYLSGGRLLLCDGEGPGRPVESAFAQGVRDREAAAQARAGWKSGGQAGLFSRGQLWNVQQGDPRALLLRFTGVAPGVRPGEIQYVLQTDTVGGLFSQDLAQGVETRLFHRESLQLCDLDKHPDQDLYAGARRQPNGTSVIATISGASHDVTEVTGGDAWDEAPSWRRDAPRQLVYSSAGVARNEAGHAVGLGPFSIQQLDLDRAEVTPVLEDERHDLLQPHVLASGDLLFIRRPYEAGGRRRLRGWDAFRDFVLIPFRLLRAFFHFLDFFSRVFSKEPLTAAGGPKAPGMDERSLVLRGRLIEAARMAGDDKEEGGLVPSNWELVRRDAKGGEKVLAQGVASYDVSADGTMVYTNGRRVWRLAPDGRPEPMFKDRLVEHVAILAE